MSTQKLLIRNVSPNPILFNYQNATDRIWYYQIVLLTGQERTIWCVENTLSYSGPTNGLFITNKTTTVCGITPTPTPTVTVTPTVTPTVTQTVTPTASVTPSVTPTITPTTSVTPTVTPTITPTTSVTPTVTPTSGGTTYSICQEALGGIIAYILQPGDIGYDPLVQHGLVAATTDVASGIGATWGCFGTVITGADGILIGTGSQNTTDIVTDCPTAGIAARLCDDLVSGGYNDWYLPSKDELNQLYINKSCLSLTNTDYWSSTEFDNNNAYRQNMTAGAVTTVSKNGGAYVRAVRSF